MKNFQEFGEYILANSKHKECTSNKVHVIINYPKIKWDSWAEYMATLTWFSGIPLQSGGSKGQNVIFAETIDEGLALADKYDFAMISYIGSFYYNTHDENVHTLFEKFCYSGHPVRGHLLFHPDKEYGRLHPQTIFLDLTFWRYIGRPSFGKYTGKVINYHRSVSNVHDDYTPHWVGPGAEYTHVTDCEQAEFISAILERHKTILNFDKERSTKFFCYPERGYSQALEAERNRDSNIVYTRNNEKIQNIKTSRKYDVIYAPAAGQIAEFLYDRFGHENTELVIFDYNEDSLKWKRMIYSMARSPEDLKSIEDHFRKKDCIVDDCSYKTTNNNEVFNDEQWISVLQKVKPTIIKYDLLEGPFDVDPDKTNLVYLSNVFSYNFLIHTMRIEDINAKMNEYLELPNTTIYGKNVFKDTVLRENH
jgi:hypothetical protein